MALHQPMLHEKKEEMLLTKIRQRCNEFGNLRYVSPKQIENIQIRETTAYEKIEDALKASGWKDIKVGDSWAGNGEFAWFKMQFTVPKEFDGKTLVGLFRFGTTGWLGGEGCLFINGVPYQGVDPNHPDVILTEKAKTGQKFELVAECVSTPVWQNNRHVVKMERADIAVLNPAVKDYYFDLNFITCLAECLPKESRRRAVIVRTANKSVDAFNPEAARAAGNDAGSASAKAAGFDALTDTAKKAAKILAPLYKAQADASAIEFACNGHSHIDVAWLWPYAETIRKCSRTFSTVDRLMEEYPDYLFTQSQAQLYEFTKDHYPDLYARVKKRVKERRLEPQGSMWVEADCNICSGESLVRQIVLGKRFFMDEFGIETDVLWLPDVFGYSAALPQILKKAAVKYFSTIKISWNQFNKFPYTSFWWAGIDGTKVLAHFPPTNDYNARIDPKQIRTGADDYREKDRSDFALYPFGFGDGGGGPTIEHLEHLKRAKNLEGLPKCTPMWVADFFHQLEKRSEDLPEWVGELYLELHRGTLTTQARNKRSNRKSELLFRDAEMAAGLAWVLTKAEYPIEQITRAWKMICKNQFHDVIPGTSVTDVYKDTALEYKEIEDTGTWVRDTGLAKIGGKAGKGENILVFNSLNWDRHDAAQVSVPGKASDWHVETDHGVALRSQASKVDSSLLWFQPESVPGIGVGAFKLVKGAPKSGRSDVKVSDHGMENAFYRIKLDKSGQISSIFDKRQNREVLPAGEKANVMQLFEDKPLAWDAWDVDFFYQDKGSDITDVTKIEVEDHGPVRGSLKITRRFGSSQIEQRIVLWGADPRIDFETRVDWHEDRKMLKVAFPVDVHTSTARFDIQFGSVDRPTHWNTSWDFARVEVAAHKWVDMSQADHGVSLINDCKYGHDVHQNVMRLTLLRSPKHPDPDADMGEHLFTYSILPHAGDWREGETVRNAHELNVQMTTWTTADEVEARTMLSADAPNVVIDTVKKADREDALIVRMYECSGMDAQCTLTAGFPIGKASECDLLERDLHGIKHNGSSIAITMKPFELKTIKLTL